jgi:hypothetical protein
MRKIYSKAQIMAATIVCNPLVSGYLLSENFKTFGTSGTAVQTWLFTGVLTFLFIALGVFDPKMMKTIPFAIIGLNSALVARLTKTYQDDDIERYKRNGGSIYGWGRVILIMLFGLIVSVAMAMGISFLVNNYLPQPEK